MPSNENDASHAQNPEMPAVRTTIVGGRPPGSGKALGDIPRGIEVLVKKASVDPAFRALLMSERSKAADEIGLVLEPSEALMLDIVPQAQLEAIIAQTKVESSKMPAFLGKAAAVMLVALGVSAVSGQVMRPAGILIGPIDVNPPTSAPATQPATQTSQPATTQASQPSTAPAVTREQIMAILKYLDSDAYKEREAAQKKLQDLGVAALPPLREILKTEKLSAEVDSRIKNAMWNIKATTRPALLEPPRPVDVRPMKGLRADPPPQPEEKPED